MNFRFFYLWLRASTVLPYSLSKNRLFIERCLARRKLFSSYSNLIQNSLWTSTQHPLFSKGQFNLFKVQLRRTFVRVLFIIIFYCLSYGTYTYMAQTSSLYSRFFFWIPFLQLFYLFFVNILFSFFFLSLNSIIVASELLRFNFLKHFVLYLKQLIIHRTFLSITTPVRAFNDNLDIKSIPRTSFLFTNAHYKLPIDFYRLKKSTNYQFDPSDIFSINVQLSTPAKTREEPNKLDCFSIEYNLTNALHFNFYFSNSFTTFWAYFWNVLYKKIVNFSLLQHWLSTNPIVSYSDLRLASESFSFFRTPEIPKSIFKNLNSYNSTFFDSFGQSIVFLLKRQSTFFENLFFFKVQKSSLLQNDEFRFTPFSYTPLPSVHQLGSFVAYLALHGIDVPPVSSNKPPKTGSSVMDASGFFVFTDFHFLSYNLALLRASIEYTSLNSELYTFIFNPLFMNDDKPLAPFSDDFFFNRRSYVRVNFLN